MYKFKVDKRCSRCRRLYSATLKNPTICGECWQKYVAPQRKKYGLTPTPNVNVEVIAKREIEKKKYLEWMREEMQSDNFGKRVRVKKKFK